MSLLDIVTDFLFKLDKNTKRSCKKAPVRVRVYQTSKVKAHDKDNNTEELEARIREKIELSRLQRSFCCSSNTTFINDLASGINRLESALQKENIDKGNLVKETKTENKNSYALNGSFVLSL